MTELYPFPTFAVEFATIRPKPDRVRYRFWPIAALCEQRSPVAIDVGPVQSKQPVDRPARGFGSRRA